MTEVPETVHGENSPPNSLPHIQHKHLLDRFDDERGQSAFDERGQSAFAKWSMERRVKPPTGAHFVIVDGAESGVVSVRDPYGRSAPGPGQGLEGTVRLEDFMEYWRRGINEAIFPAGKKRNGG